MIIRQQNKNMYRSGIFGQSLYNIGSDFSPIRDIEGCVLALAPFRLDGFSSGLPFLLARNSTDTLEHDIFDVNSFGYWKTDGGWQSPVSTLYPVHVVNQGPFNAEVIGSLSWVNYNLDSFSALGDGWYNCVNTLSSGLVRAWKWSSGNVFIPTNIGDVFEIDIEISVNSGSSTWSLHVRNQLTEIISQIARPTVGRRKYYLYTRPGASATTGCYIWFYSSSAVDFKFKVHSFKKIAKLSSYQTTAAYQSKLTWPSPSGLPYLSFDGTDDRMMVAHSTDIDFGAADSFTIFMRVKPATSGTSCFLCDKYTSNNGYRLLRNGSTGKIQFLSYSGGASKTTQTDNAYADQWINVAVVVDRATATQRLYVANEIIETDISGHGTFENTNDLLIGSNTSQATFAPVIIKAGFFYSEALTESQQIKQILAWPEGR